MEAPIGSPSEWEVIICTFIRDHVRRAGATGLVIGLSGGLDSAVVAALACRALGKENVAGYLLPSGSSHPSDELHASELATSLGLAPTTISIEPMVAAAAKSLDLEDAARRGNMKARCRMAALYAEAQRLGYLVSGTGNKSELLTGYFSKHGDGGNDLQPIGDLYKTQVRELATHLQIPAAIISKPPSAGLVPGQTDEDDLGVTYENLDRILKGFELNQNPSAIAERTKLPLETVTRVGKMVRRSEHKRQPPVVAKIGARTVGIDWLRSVHWDD